MLIVKVPSPQNVGSDSSSKITMEPLIQHGLFVLKTTVKCFALGIAGVVRQLPNWPYVGKIPLKNKINCVLELYYYIMLYSRQGHPVC